MDNHAHTELSNSSIAGIENADQMQDSFVYQRGPDGKLNRVQVRTPGRNTARRQQYLQRDDQKAFDTVTWLEQIRKHAEQRATTRSSKDYEDLRLEDRAHGNFGPQGIYAVLTLNTFLDMVEYLKGAGLKDPDMYRRSEFQALDLLRHIAADPDQVNDFIARHELENA